MRQLYIQEPWANLGYESQAQILNDLTIRIQVLENRIRQLAETVSARLGPRPRLRKDRRCVPGAWHGQLSPLPGDAVEAETGPLAPGVGGSGALEAIGDRRPREFDPWSPERVDEHRLPPGSQEP